jgi:hypothetical protein
MPMNIQDLSGKVAIVIGAFSGIGLATANMLAREGVRVALFSLTFRTNKGNITSEFGNFSRSIPVTLFQEWDLPACLLAHYCFYLPLCILRGHSTVSRHSGSCHRSPGRTPAACRR